MKRSSELFRGRGVIALLAGLAAACGGTTLESSDGHGGRGGASGSGDENAGKSGSIGGHGESGGQRGNTAGTGGGGAESTASGGAGSGGEATDASTDIPPDLRRKATVWIGQTNVAITLPERVDADVKDKPHKVVLILAPVVNEQSLGGTITFGEGAPPPAPTSAGATFPPRSTSFPSNWSSLPYAGFEYTLVWSILTQNHFSMAYVPSELFRDWCALQTPRPDGYGMGGSKFCDCSDTECHSVSEPIDRIELVVHGDDMEGQLAATSSDQVDPIQVRLKRVN